MVTDFMLGDFFKARHPWESVSSQRPTLTSYDQRFSTDLFEEETTESWMRRQRGVLFQTMLNAGTLTFEEFAMREELPLATIHEAVLDFLRGRDDAAVFGAQAVNAYVGEARMSQDIDLISTRAGELAEELRAHLSERFHIAVRVRVI